MNRNNERHFLQIPEIHASRTRFNRDQTILTTFDSGKLIPFFVDEVLPGDTFQVDTSAIIRMTTPKYPVMDDAFIDFYYFYCPNRILWDNFKYFMGEVEDKPWMPTKAYSVPQIQINGTESSPKPSEETILDYMGVPTKIKHPFKINALPIRAYVKIWNEFFRDENVGNAAVFKTDDGTATEAEGTTNEEILKNAITGGKCLPVNRFHDYFSSCLPYAQRGPEVSIPMTGNAAVKGYKTFEYNEPIKGNISPVISGAIRPGAEVSATPNYVKFENTQSGTGYLGADLSTVTATTINELRNAIAVQQYYEAMARGGSRYREQVQALWNVTISDKTVQVPEYLGGGRYHVNMNQIVQNHMVMWSCCLFSILSRHEIA
jgi:hypothetical protein